MWFVLRTERTCRKQGRPLRKKRRDAFYGERGVYSRSSFRYVMPGVGDKETHTHTHTRRSRVIVMEQNEKGRHGEKRKMFPREQRSWKGLSGDEYECMKMKCLSQYGDSAGTQVTEECSATPTLGG